MTGFTFVAQLPFNYHLRGNTGVIGTRLPKRVITLHAMITNQRIHDGVLEGMTHVQAAGHVRRRDHDTVGVTVTMGSEVAFVFPALIPGFFNRMGVVSFFHQQGSLNRKGAIIPCPFAVLHVFGA